ncbi:MAG: trypsin-like serine protease [Rivularia sp. (in: Bacteria)]|nr:trypsin-like serine protease [Rivularia sp. MS3]
MNKKPFVFLIASILIGIALSSLTNQAEAENEVQTAETPEFINVQDGDNIQLQGDGKPFKPADIKQSDKPSDDRAIFAEDNRRPMLSRDYPWAAIGRIEGVKAEGKEKVSYHCTGSLITEDIVLTNAHCVVDPYTHEVSKEIKFRPNLINGSSKDDNDTAVVKKIIAGTNFKEANPSKNDWAVVKIDKPLGKKYGHFGWVSLPTSTMLKHPKKFRMIGYSRDFPTSETLKAFPYLKAGEGLTAGVHDGCSILKEENGSLSHDCDTTGGSSGDPIVAQIKGKYYIIALNNAERFDMYGKPIDNRAVKVSFLDRLFGRR